MQCCSQIYLFILFFKSILMNSANVVKKKTNKKPPKIASLVINLLLKSI